MKAILGTAQFVQNYGLKPTNFFRKAESISKVLKLANDLDWYGIDTAPKYGFAEEMIGNHKGLISNLEIFSKVRINSDEIDLVDSIKLSLKKLNLKKISGILIHNPEQLTNKKSLKNFQSLVELKEREVINKIGASIYTVSDLENLLQLTSNIDLLQIPVNPLNNELINSSVLKEFQASSNIEIHVRSVFSQGLLISDPVKLSNFFDPIKPLISNWQNDVLQKGIDLITACLAFQCQVGTNYLILGVNNDEQLLDINNKILSLNQSKEVINYNVPALDLLSSKHDLSKFADPRNWH